MLNTMSKTCTCSSLGKEKTKKEKNLKDNGAPVLTPKTRVHFKWMISSGVRDTMWTSYHPALCVDVPQRYRRKE